MNTRLLRSLFSLVAVVALGGGVTYALINGNTVTISANTLGTGSGNIKICNAADTNKWDETITGFTLSNLVPGDENKQLTADEEVYLGNDGGDLENNNLGGTKCNSYNGDIESDSSINLRMVPKVTYESCPLENDFNLKFQIGAAGNATDYKTLAEWKANEDQIPPTFSPDEIKQVKIFASMDSESSGEGTCGFSVTFMGQSVAPTPSAT